MKAFWNAAIVLLLVGGAVSLFMRGRAPGPRAAAPSAQVPIASAPVAPAASAPAESPPTPRDAGLTEELLRANANLESDPELLDRYRDIDARYFARGLPPATVRWEPRLAEVGPTIAENFRLEGATDGRLILLNPAIRADEQELKRALVHEIVHVAVWKQDRAHGPVFQTFLRGVAEQGAFQGVLATDEEKQELRSTLDTRAAALKDDADALLKARAEIDAADSSLRADRARDYNARVEQHNAAVADFNRLAERYNLMIVYPDGLDRERVDRRAAFADTGRR